MQRGWSLRSWIKRSHVTIQVRYQNHEFSHNIIDENTYIEEKSPNSFNI